MNIYKIILFAIFAAKSVSDVVQTSKLLILTAMTLETKKEDSLQQQEPGN